MKKYHFSNLRLLQVTSASVVIIATNAFGGIKRDYGTYPVPPPPPLPAAGGTVVDPTFGTTIMRLTDENDGPGCINSYSYWPTFNLDNTRLLVFSGVSPLLYRFDPVNFKILDKLVWTTTLRWEDAIWSGTDPDVLYAHDFGMHLFTYDVATQTSTQIADLSPLYRNGDYLWQMSKSIANDNIFAFTRRDARYHVVGYLVWQRDINQVIYSVDTSEVDEVQVDKTGKYLAVKTGLQGPGAIEVKVVDLKTFVVQDLTDDGPDYAPGHSDNGRKTVIGHDNWRNQLTYRTLAQPHLPSTLISFGDDWTQDYHVSMLADNEKWVLISSYSVSDTPDGPFHEEIYQVATDGSGAVRRMAHHFSVYDGDYYESPRADISRDGRFVAFTSNWGVPGGRLDVFILKIR